MCVHVCEYDHYYRWSDCFIFTAHHQSIHFSSFSSFIFLFLQHVCAKWRFVFKFEYVFEGKVNRRKSYDNTHTQTHAKNQPEMVNIGNTKDIDLIKTAFEWESMLWTLWVPWNDRSTHEHWPHHFNISVSGDWFCSAANKWIFSKRQKRLEMLLQVELAWKVRFCENNILWTFRKSVDWNRSPKEETNRSFGDCK